MFVPIYPATDDGDVLESATDFTLDSVDAEVINANWRNLFSLINGNLHGTNLDPSVSLEEENIIFPPSSGVASIVGGYHDHDGITSALLEPESIAWYQNGVRTMGGMVSGSKGQVLCIQCRVVIPSIRPFYLTYKVAVPFNPNRWAPLNTSNVYGIRAIAAYEGYDLVTNTKETLRNLMPPAVIVTYTSGSFTQLSVTTYSQTSVLYNVPCNINIFITYLW